MSLPTLYEDPAVLVIDKPCGLPSVRISKSRALTVADFLKPGCEPVHRLDNNTSGGLLIAKTPAAYNALRQQFDAATIYKEYLALVLGHPPLQGSCTVPIAHSAKSSKRMRCAAADEKNQPAHTEWEVICLYPPSPIGPIGYTLLRIRISTGVRHQIRVHLSHMGHPLVGDTLYQSRSQRNCDLLHLPHHLLHAARIGFVSPATHKNVECNAPLPELFGCTLKSLDETQNRR